MVALAILSLVISLVVSNTNYGARARAMEANYKRIQQIAYTAQHLLVTTPSKNLTQRFAELQHEYEVEIDSSENHITADYHRSKKVKSKDVSRNRLLDMIPYATILVPLTLLVPFAVWYINGL